jgi:hypothetical protein
VPGRVGRSRGRMDRAEVRPEGLGPCSLGALRCFKKLRQLGQASTVPDTEQEAIRVQ